MSGPRDISKPQPGYWLVQLAKSAPWVPAAIIRHHSTYEPGAPLNKMDRSPFLVAYIRGEQVPLHAVWERRGRPITEAEYHHQLRICGWADKHAPDAPEAKPREAIDLNSLKPIF